VRPISAAEPPDTGRGSQAGERSRRRSGANHGDVTHGIITPGNSFAERATSAIANPELQRALRNLDIRLHTAGAVADTMPEMKDRRIYIELATKTTRRRSSSQTRLTLHRTKWYALSMRRVFRTRTFTLWMRKAGLTDDALCDAVSEMAQGLVDADLGGHVLKKRVALSGQGKRGGGRTMRGPSPITAMGRQAFANQLDRWLTTTKPRDP